MANIWYFLETHKQILYFNVWNVYYYYLNTIFRTINVIFGTNILKKALTPTQTIENNNKSNHNGIANLKAVFNSTYNGIMILPWYTNICQEYPPQNSTIFITKQLVKKRFLNKASQQQKWHNNKQIPIVALWSWEYSKDQEQTKRNQAQGIYYPCLYTQNTLLFQDKNVT